MGRLAVATMFGVSMAAACGGRTLDEPRANMDAGILMSGTGGIAGTGGAASTNPNATDHFNGSVRLPPCKLGVERAKAGGDCEFLTAGRCYSTKIAACACACPANKSGTTCASGFPDSNNAALVTCS